MAQTRSTGHFRAGGLYSSLDEIDGYIAEAAGIIHKPKVSAEDMKKAEQLKNLARAKIGCGNLRRDLLMGWDKIVKALDTLGEKARKSA
jgi:phosphoglycerate dehydrogenase-like enzyme